MSEMREAWVNVSTVSGEAVLGINWKTPALAEAVSHHAQFRIHVRLKPEGAPRRYASEMDRWLWEAGAPALARLSCPRTPKTEESAS